MSDLGKHVSSSGAATPVGELKWVVPELRHLDVQRKTEGGPIVYVTENAYYRPS